MDNALIGGLAFWLLASIVFLIRRGRKGLWKFGLKEWYEGFVHIFGFVGAIFFLLLGLIMLPGLIKYLESLKLSESWLSLALPWTYLVMLLALYSVLIKDLFKWAPKYTDGERVILLEERIKFKKKLGWFGRFMKIKEIDGSSN